MTIPEILQALEYYTGRFPAKAMAAAVQQRDAITPELLRVVEEVAADPVAAAAREEYMLPQFAIYLLAQFRERHAFAPMVRMFSAPGEIPFDLFGDTITETLERILASVYDGNPALLQGLVEGAAVNEFVRTASLRAFVALVHTGQMPHAEVAAYFRSLFHGKLPRSVAVEQVWDGLVSAVSELPEPALLPEMRQAFEDDLVQSGFADFELLERRTLATKGPDRRKYRLIEDAIGELRGWAAFDPREVARRANRPTGPSGGNEPSVLVLPVEDKDDLPDDNAPLTIPEILAELETYTGWLPDEALAAAVAQREAITPELLRVVEAVAADPAAFADHEDYWLHIFAIHLLAEFREPRAFAPILRLLSMPGEAGLPPIEKLLFEGPERILASVYDGNPVPLYTLIESPTAKNFARDCAIHTLVALVHNDRLARADVTTYFRSLFREKLERKPSAVWDSLVTAVGLLPAAELLDEVRAIYAAELADTAYGEFAEVERDILDSEGPPLVKIRLVDSAAAELARWDAFAPEPDFRAPVPNYLPPAESILLPPEPYIPPQPIVKGPKIGRNDPCPCGSGKKYKKCCGQ